MNHIRKQSHWVLLILFLLIGGIFFMFLYTNSEKKDKEARLLKLHYQHNQSIDQLTSSIDKFAGLVSGMKSYVNLSTEFPSSRDFQKFVSNQYSDLNLHESVVISFIDSTHIFRQSFTLNAIDPINLVGKSVSLYRTQEKIKYLDNLMTHDSIIMFPPINLLEGWVGIPINFRVHRNGSTFGYVAPIISFKSILNEIYENDMEKEFVFQIRTQEGYDVDRERTYNNTESYNKSQDPEYYKNFKIDPSKFLYTTKKYYGFDLTIGTAYKNAYGGNESFKILLILIYLTISILAFVVAWQIHRFRILNTKLINQNKLLLKKRQLIETNNQQLQKLNDTQTKFFSIIGHDIKQPLNAIEGLLSLLQYEEINDPDLAEIIKNLNKSTKNTTTLLNNLLRWARSQMGDIKFVPTTLDLNKIIEEAIETLFYQAKEKSIKIIHHPQNPLTYKGDKDMLSTIFRNLISNAIKFTNLGGTIKIEIRKLEKTIEVAVIDNGIGMTPEEVKSLFELSTQISTVGTSGEMGTGLGLILSDMFIKNHGGQIKIESELERGSTFTVVLPT